MLRDATGGHRTFQDLGRAPVPSKHSASGDRQDEYPWFDWLRFALASVVVLDHSGASAFFPFLNGTLAVKVFFALSGWLIGGILLRSGKQDLPRFFFNRATRIWIPYALAILLIYGLAAAREGIDFFWVKYLVLDVTFTHQLYTFFPQAFFELPLDGSGNQFWSISVEEQFYLLAPIIILFLPFGRSVLSWGVLAPMLVALDWHAGSVALGVCAAILQHDHAIASRPWVRVLALVAAVTCAALMSVTASQYVVGPLFALSVVVATAIPGKRSPVALIAGGLSYPLYLNHWIGEFAVNFVTKRWLPVEKPVHIAAVYTVAVLIALGLYWVVDRQVQVRRNRWYRPALGRRLAILAYLLVGIGLIAGAALHYFGPHAVVPAGYVPPYQ